MSNESVQHTIPILRATLDNDAFRQVLLTGEMTQVVAMSIAPGEDIGLEVHEDHDQVLIFVEGSGEAIIGGNRTPVGPNDLTFVRAGVEHNFVNTGAEPLRLFTLYAPPEHEAGTRHANKAEADAAEGH